MKLVKATKLGVERLVGLSDGQRVEIWQYPKQVCIEVDGKIVTINRRELKNFLAREAK